MPEVQLIARYTIAAGREDELLPLLGRLAAASRNEPGNLGFQVYREVGEDRQIVLLERYASTAALDAHRETAHFKELVLERIVPLLESRVVEIYDAGS